MVPINGDRGVQGRFGRSGHVGSKHYDDLMDDWRQGGTRNVYRTEDEVLAAGEAELLELEPR